MTSGADICGDHGPPRAGGRRVASHRRRVLLRTPLNAAIASLVVGGVTLMSGPANAHADPSFPVESLNGWGNNLGHPTWGLAGTEYSRVAPAHYADGRSAPVSGPNSQKKPVELTPSCSIRNFGADAT